MIKVRIEGKDEDIYHFVDVISASKELELLSVSTLYTTRNPLSVFKRCFIDIDFKENKEKENG